LRVAIVNLTSGGLSGGYRKYLCKLLPLIAKQYAELELNVFIPAQRCEDFALPGVSVRTWPAGLFRGSIDLLRREVTKLRPEVVFIPTARWIDFQGIPTVVMLRNMEPLVAPCAGNPWRERLVNCARAWEARSACRRATRIIAVSKFVQTFLMQRWKIDPEKIGLVYHGVDEEVVPAEPPPSIAAACSGRFLFTAGSIRPARGLEELLCALARVKGLGHLECLIVAGCADPGMMGFKGRLEQMAQELGVAEQVIWAGQLSAQEMAWCFKHSIAFVMSSHAEACPNIVLEALAGGAICVSTDQEPMPEFFGNAALYYQRKNPDALANKIIQTLRLSEAQRTDLRQRAKWRSMDFRWENTAKETLQQLQLVAGASWRGGLTIKIE